MLCIACPYPVYLHEHRLLNCTEYQMLMPESADDASSRPVTAAFVICSFAFFATCDVFFNIEPTLTAFQTDSATLDACSAQKLCHRIRLFLLIEAQPQWRIGPKLYNAVAPAAATQRPQRTPAPQTLSPSATQITRLPAHSPLPLLTTSSDHLNLALACHGDKPECVCTCLR